MLYLEHTDTTKWIKQSGTGNYTRYYIGYYTRWYKIRVHAWYGTENKKNYQTKNERIVWYLDEMINLKINGKSQT